MPVRSGQEHGTNIQAGELSLHLSKTIIYKLKYSEVVWAEKGFVSKF